MAEYLCDMSENERKTFFDIVELNTDRKSIETYFQNIKKKLGRDSVDKIKTLFYKGIMAIHAICEKEGINLSIESKDFIFIDLSDFETFFKKKYSNFKKQVTLIFKDSTALKVKNIQNLIKGFKLAIKLHILPHYLNTQNIQQVLTHESVTNLCKFCGKARKRAASSLNYISMPETLVVRLLPINQNFHKVLVRHGFNPRLELYLRPNKLLIEVIEHLSTKWNPSLIESSGQEFTVCLLATWESKLIEYSWTQEKITIGDVYMSLDSPVPWVLYYCWKPTHPNVPFNPIPMQSDNSLKSANFLNMMDDASNSVPFLANFESQKITESSMDPMEDFKSISLRSPFKKLFSQKISEETFSKGEDDPRPFTVPRELAQEFSQSLMEIRDGEESMFTTWFSINKNHI